MQRKVVRILFFMLVFLLVLQLFGNSATPQKSTDEVVLSSKSAITIGKDIVIGIENLSTETLLLKNDCPKNPLKVEFYKNGEWLKLKSTLADAGTCEGLKDVSLAPNGKTQIPYANWRKELFGELGRYRISLDTTLQGKEKVYTHEFEITPPNFFQRTWDTVLYRPILNTLFFFIVNIPGNNLGWAILLLTILIKLILLVPNQKALKSQRALQIIQPQLEALKLKHKGNPQVLAEETMKIWKEHKVNPMGSCLPMLIQFPILIALFYVVKDGLSVDTSHLYGMLRGFNPAEVNTVFFGLHLTKVNALALPIAIGALQFIQIRLSFAKQPPGAAQGQAAMMNKMMQFVLPVMIGVFAAGLPAAVGFYWGISTLFAVGQQMVVNRAK